LGPLAKIFDDINEQLTKFKARAAERPDVTEKLEAFVQTLAQFGPPHARPGAPPSLFVLESVERLFNENPRRGCRSDRRGQKLLSRMFRQKLGR